MDKTIRKYTSFDEMKADEYRYWQSRPVHERLQAVSDLSWEQYAMKGEVADVPRLERTLVRFERVPVKCLSCRGSLRGTVSESGKFIHLMTKLTADEMGIFELGEQVEVPIAIQEDGFCFHQSVWFVTGRIPNVPKWPNWASHISSFLGQAEYLSYEPVFETSDYAGVTPLSCLGSVGPGVYLMQLLDSIEMVGHWVGFDTKFGVFEPGTGRKNIPLVGWTHFLGSRFRIRRILKINTQAD